MRVVGRVPGLDINPIHNAMEDMFAPANDTIQATPIFDCLNLLTIGRTDRGQEVRKDYAPLQEIDSPIKLKRAGVNNCAGNPVRTKYSAGNNP